jgi:SAM-dependent methyltransferase
MSVSERLLIALSRSPNSRDYQPPLDTESVDSALDLLTAVFPDFGRYVKGKRVVDFGCGQGFQAIALVKRFQCTVVGIDTNPSALRDSSENATRHNVPDSSLTLVSSATPAMAGQYDAVISQNAFEHYENPAAALTEMVGLINDSGIVLMTFGPPWFSPYGSHMGFFCRVPWLNVLFPEGTVMRVRSRYRTDGASAYEDIEGGLNRMTIRKFETIISACTLRTRYLRYDCVKRINVLGRVPYLREFFINHVTIALSKA